MSASDEECVTSGDEPFVPTRFHAQRTKSVPVMTVGIQDGAAGTPPKNQPYKVAWFNGSPRPGHGTGNVVMTTHTYGSGNALGNDLGNRTKVGDVWKVTDGRSTRCYEVIERKKFKVADYDVDSDLIYDADGPEEIAMVICWDKNWATDEWASRIVFTARLIEG